MAKWRNKKYKPVEKVEIKCKECGNTFLGHRNQIYCSKFCSERYNARKNAEKYIPKPKKNYNKKCQICGKEYISHQPLQKFCSKECCNKFYREKNHKMAIGEFEDMKQGLSINFYKLRFEIFKRDNFRCQYCGRNPKEDGCKLIIEHIFPKSKGGALKPSNLTTACEECNLGKRDILLEERQLRRQKNLVGLSRVKENKAGDTK